MKKNLTKIILFSFLATVFFGIKISASKAESATDYKSVTQIEQLVCNEYDSESRCIGTGPRTTGFKNMFSPEKIISQYDKGESYVREDFRACDFNGGNYCNYSHQELSTFKVYIPPNTKQAEISIYNSQGNTPNTIKFVAIARFGEPPQGDYSHIEAYGQMPPSMATGGRGCTIKEATGKDCVVRNSDGITNVLSDGSIEKGGWLYVKFVELENVFYGLQSLITVDSQKYKAWYDNMTATNSWLSNGDPGETTLVGDLDKNGKVDIFDYNLFLSEFGKTMAGNIADLDQNGKVDIFDYNIFVSNFGKTG